MDKYIFRNAVLRETNGFFRDNRFPHDLVIIKNNAVKLLDSLDEDDKLTVLEQLLQKEPKKINHLKNMLTNRGGFVVIRQPRVPDCDVEIVKYGTNLHFNVEKNSTLNEMGEISLNFSKEKQPDTVKKFIVSENGDLVEYQENIKDENINN